MRNAAKTCSGFGKPLSLAKMPAAIEPLAFRAPSIVTVSSAALAAVNPAAVSSERWIEAAMTSLRIFFLRSHQSSEHLRNDGRPSVRARCPARSGRPARRHVQTDAPRCPTSPCATLELPQRYAVQDQRERHGKGGYHDQRVDERPRRYSEPPGRSQEAERDRDHEIENAEQVPTHGDRATAVLVAGEIKRDRQGQDPDRDVADPRRQGKDR